MCGPVQPLIHRQPPGQGLAVSNAVAEAGCQFLEPQFFAGLLTYLEGFPCVGPESVPNDADVDVGPVAAGCGNGLQQVCR